MEIMMTENNKIRICKNIRKLGKLGRWYVKEDHQVSSKNQILLEYLKFCGSDVTEFLNEYLANIQPYMISRIHKGLKLDRAVCIMENHYMVELSVEYDENGKERLAVSFAEQYLKETKEYDMAPKIGRNDKMPIFADSIGAHVVGTNHYVVNALIPFGTQVFPVCVAGEKKEDVFWVTNSEVTKDIEDSFELAMDETDFGVDEWEVWYYFSGFSKNLAYKCNVFRNLSCLCDCLLKCDRGQREYDGTLLAMYLHYVAVTKEQKEELCGLLRERYELSADNVEIVLSYIEESIKVYEE